MKRTHFLQNARGQVTTEIVLMLVVTMAVAVAVSTAATNNNWFANLVSAPWQNLASIIQNGVPGNVQQTSSQHPKNYSRWSTVQGDALE